MSPACSSSRSARLCLELTLWLSMSRLRSPSEPRDAQAAGTEPCQGEHQAGHAPPLLLPQPCTARGRGRRSGRLRACMPVRVVPGPGTGAGALTPQRLLERQGTGLSKHSFVGAWLRRILQLAPPLQTSPTAPSRGESLLSLPWQSSAQNAPTGRHPQAPEELPVP